MYVYNTNTTPIYIYICNHREERVFRMWINSLNIDGLYINNLFTDCRDGVNLIKVIDQVRIVVVVCIFIVYM